MKKKMKIVEVLVPKSQLKPFVIEGATTAKLEEVKAFLLAQREQYPDDSAELKARSAENLAAIEAELARRRLS